MMTKLLVGVCVALAVFKAGLDLAGSRPHEPTALEQHGVSNR